jgi:hypothetical protein
MTERPYETSCRRVGETALGPAGDRQWGWVEFEYRRSCEMCLMVEWDLLDTDSTEEEFDGSWRVRATGSASRDSRQIGSKRGPLGQSAHRET